MAVDGRAAGKSDRLVAGTWLEVELSEPERPAVIAAPPEVVAGLAAPSSAARPLPSREMAVP